MITVGSFISLGYGDVVPISINEKVFTIIAIIFSCIIFGYVLNKIGSIFAASDDQMEEYREKTASMNLYFEKHDVERSLRIRTRNYYEYIYERFMNRPDEEQLFKILPDKMTDQISNALYKNKSTT